MALINVTNKAEFEASALKNEKLVLVDFWAPWCAPCRMIAPILEDLSKKLEADIDIIKVDIEASPENSQLAKDYGVQGIPNMQIFKNGEVVEELIGMRTGPVLEDELKKHIG